MNTRQIPPLARVLPLAGIFCIGLANFGNAMWIGAKAQLAQYLIASSWAATLRDGEANPPWKWADTWPVARMQHPASGTDLYVLEGADGSSLAFGPGHMSGTDMPGENDLDTGASLIGGHRDTHFRFLKDVQLGEELLVQTRQGKWVQFVIDEIRIANIKTDPLLLPTDDHRLVLVTCYPFDDWIPGGPMRYVVEARSAINADR